jgi:uncharacterized membrane protein
MGLSGDKPRTSSGRFEFIDFTRGVVMAIMAWDHVSGFWNSLHHGGEGVGGNAPEFANVVWFFARFVSHYCAPTFIFLAGTVLAISTIRRAGRGQSEWSLTFHLIVRGLVLLLMEALVVSPAFGTTRYYFGVIACIGACFILFSVARKLPIPVLFMLSLFTVLNHSFLNLDFIPNDVWWGHYLRVIIHEPNYDWRPFVGLYPIIPWIGVMGIGWTFGSYLLNLSPDQIANLREPLKKIGYASIATYFLVRLISGYGTLVPREGFGIMDIMYVSKYPPSVAFLLWTMGGMCLFMSLGLQIQGQPGFHEGFTGVILAYGRNPLFFYLTHLWLYRLRPWWVTRGPFALPLIPTLALWIMGLAVLWQLCIRYEVVKRRYPRSFLQYI